MHALSYNHKSRTKDKDGEERKESELFIEGSAYETYCIEERLIINVLVHNLFTELMGIGDTSNKITFESSSNRKEFHGSQYPKKS